MAERLRRVGHKGADAIVPGNTIASFRAAVAAGADTIEFDVLRPRADFPRAADWRRAAAGPAPSTAPLLVAHDWGDAAGREPHTLAEVLDAFREPPLDTVEIDCDLKLPGREDELVAALGERVVVEVGERDDERDVVLGDERAQRGQVRRVVDARDERVAVGVVERRRERVDVRRERRRAGARERAEDVDPLAGAREEHGRHGRQG